MSFADELEQMVDDCVDILSAGRTVTVRTRTAGSYDAATGKHAGATEVSDDVSAVRGSMERLTADGGRGGRGVVRTTYLIKASDLAGGNHGATAPREGGGTKGTSVIDGDLEFHVTAAIRQADSKGWLLQCESGRQ